MAVSRILLERRFSDLDLLGHVNNVVYHDYLQEARFRLLAGLGRETVEQLPQVVARQEIDYLKPIGISLDPVVVDTWIESIGRTSYVVGYAIHDGDGPVAARAKTVMVVFDPVTSSARTIPPEFRRWLESSMRETGDQE